MTPTLKLAADLMARLRSEPKHFADHLPGHIEALCIAVKELSGALAPFTHQAPAFNRMPDDYIVIENAGGNITVGDLRHAALAAGEKT